MGLFGIHAFSSFQRANEAAQLDDFQGTLEPVVLPTNNYVTAGQIEAVLGKVTAAKFELDSYALPTLSLSVNAAFGFAVGITSLDGFDDESKFVSYHTKQKDDTLFVNRGVSKASKVNWLAEHGATTFLPSGLIRRPSGEIAGGVGISCLYFACSSTSKGDSGS
jgi:hypothetical protein